MTERSRRALYDNTMSEGTAKADGQPIGADAPIVGQARRRLKNLMRERSAYMGAEIYLHVAKPQINFKHMKKIVVLTGAGISAESGIKTFRDAGGLWEGHDVMEVASPEGWHKNPELVLDFYNKRRTQLLEVEPNAGHKELVRLAQFHDVMIVTQNVDDLHERAGSKKIIHLHGELLKVRSTQDESLIYDCKKDINLGDTCELGAQLRPHIVWFGEMVPMLEPAAMHLAEAETVIIIGTSMQVYPAAGLVAYAPPFCPVYYVDPNPSINYELSVNKNLKVVAKKATEGVKQVVDEILAEQN